MTVEQDITSHYRDIRQRLFPKIRPKIIHRAPLKFVPIHEENQDWDYPPTVVYEEDDIGRSIPHLNENWTTGVGRILKSRGVTIEAACTPARAKHLVETRRLIARYLRDRHGWSMQRIGKYLGNRDHSSISMLLNPENRRAKTIAMRETARRAHDAKQ